MMEQVILDSLTPTGCKSVKLPLRLLTPEQCMNIKKSIFLDYSPPLERTLQQVIRDSGGHLRTLEIFFEQLFKNPNILHPELFTIAITVLTSRYAGFLTDKQRISTIVRCALLQKQIQPKHAILPNDTYTWKDLRDKGLISIDSEYRVVFPYFWLHVFSIAMPNLNDDIEICWSNLQNELKFNWQDFEDFNLEYLV